MDHCWLKHYVNYRLVTTTFLERVLQADHPGVICGRTTPDMAMTSSVRWSMPWKRRGQIAPKPNDRLADALLNLPDAYRDYRLVESVLPPVDEARHVFALHLVSRSLIQNPARRLELTFADAPGAQITGNAWGNYADRDAVEQGSPAFNYAALTLYNGWMSLNNIRLVDKRHAGRVEAHLVGQCKPRDRDAAIQAVVEAVGMPEAVITERLGYRYMADRLRQLQSQSSW